MNKEIEEYRNRLKLNYKTIYIGLVEGYSIEKTDETVNDFDVFNSYITAKATVMANARIDIALAKNAYKSTTAIRKKDIK